MYLDHWKSSRPEGCLLRDAHRLPQFYDKGEILAVNPRLLQKWRNEPHPDMLQLGSFWRMVTTREEYERHDAVPANEISDDKQCTPVDLVLSGPQSFLLHEVSIILPPPPFLATRYHNRVQTKTNMGFHDSCFIVFRLELWITLNVCLLRAG